MIKQYSWQFSNGRKQKIERIDENSFLELKLRRTLIAFWLSLRWNHRKFVVVVSLGAIFFGDVNWSTLLYWRSLTSWAHLFPLFLLWFRFNCTHTRSYGTHNHVVAVGYGSTLSTSTSSSIVEEKSTLSLCLWMRRTIGSTTARAVRKVNTESDESGGDVHFVDSLVAWDWAESSLRSYRNGRYLPTNDHSDYVCSTINIGLFFARSLRWFLILFYYFTRKVKLEVSKVSKK